MPIELRSDMTKWIEKTVSKMNDLLDVDAKYHHDGMNQQYATHACMYT